MNRTSLHRFAARILAEGRIRFGDLRRLQRDVLPARITSREEAEILLFLDSAVHRADRAWNAYLTATIRDFAVWGLQPAGAVDRDKARWISAALSLADGTRTARGIIREILREARRIDEDALCHLGPDTRKPCAVPPVNRADGGKCGEAPRNVGDPGAVGALGENRGAAPVPASGVSRLV